MKIKENIENVLIGIQELNIITENFKLYNHQSEQQYQIPQIDIDLALSKIRSVYNELLLVNKLNSSPQIFSTIVEIAPKIVINEERVLEIKAEHINHKEEILVDNIVDDDEISLPEIVHEVKIIPVTEPIKAPVAEVKIQIEEKPIVAQAPEIRIETPKTEIIVEAKKENIQEIAREIVINEKTIIDTAKKESIHEAISKKEQAQDFVTKLQQKPISDINEALGLAEKLHYINDLFGKNTEKFNEAVRYINICTSLEDALFYIENNYKWDFEKESTISFMELVKRKFL